MKRITEVLILGEPTSVKYKKLKPYGTYLMGEINIRNDRSPRIKMRTLIHEMGHGYFEDSHDPDSDISEEDYARLFEQSVIDLVKNNWEVVERLKEEVG